MDLSEKDRNILRMLIRNGRASLKKIAGEVGMSENGVKYRIDKLENEGYITGYSADVDMEKFGNPLGVIFSIRPKQGIRMSNLKAHLVKLRQLYTVYYTTGERPLFAIGKFRDRGELKSFIEENLISDDMITDFEYRLILEYLLIDDMGSIVSQH